MTAAVIVPDYQLSLAIGKEGQNARLAAKLTGCRVDIRSETQAAEEGRAPRPAAPEAPAEAAPAPEAETCPRPRVPEAALARGRVVPEEPSSPTSRWPSATERRPRSRWSTPRSRAGRAPSRPRHRPRNRPRPDRVPDGRRDDGSRADLRRLPRGRRRSPRCFAWLGRRGAPSPSTRRAARRAAGPICIGTRQCVGEAFRRGGIAGALRTPLGSAEAASLRRDIEEELRA